MAITLTNMQVSSLVNEAYSLATGGEFTGPLTLRDLVDNGKNAIGDLREQFTKALINVCTKNWVTLSEYRGQYNDPFFEDENRFGAITQLIDIEVPEVKDASNWQEFTSGTSKVGQYTVYLPTVTTKIYTKSSSWALPITISWEQWDTAFRSESELSNFVSYVFLAVDNALVQHMEDMNASNRNNFIAEKMLYSSKPDAKGIHVVDLVKEYAESIGLTENLPVSKAMTNKDFLTFASEKMNEYLTYFSKQTNLFNTEQKMRFTPPERLVVQLLDSFVRKMEFGSYSSAFHDAYVKLPNAQRVPWWEVAGDLSFNDISSIHVASENGTINQTGIIGLMCDKWAIMHTIRSNRVASQFFEIENLSHYEYQHRDSYMNNLTMNAVVFVAKDYLYVPGK